MLSCAPGQACRLPAVILIISGARRRNIVHFAQDMDKHDCHAGKVQSRMVSCHICANKFHRTPTTSELGRAAANVRRQRSSFPRRVCCARWLVLAMAPACRLQHYTVTSWLPHCRSTRTSAGLAKSRYVVPFQHPAFKFGVLAACHDCDFVPSRVCLRSGSDEMSHTASACALMQATKLKPRKKTFKVPPVQPLSPARVQRPPRP